MCWPCYHGDLTTFVTLKTLTSSLTQLINPLIVLHNTQVWKRECKRLIAKVNLGDKHYSKLASSLIKQPPKPWSGFRVLVAITRFTCKSWVTGPHLKHPTWDNCMCMLEYHKVGGKVTCASDALVSTRARCTEKAKVLGGKGSHASIFLNSQ